VNPFLTIQAPGGVVDGIGMKVMGAPEFRPGERALLFLASEGPVHKVVGMAAGKLDVTRDADGVERVRWARPGTGAAQVPVDEVMTQLRSAR
jgi:hypothetical protein